MKARRNRIRLQKRRPRIRMMSNPAPVAWIRGRFVDIPLTQELLEDAGVQSVEEWNRTTVPLAYYEEQTRPAIGGVQTPAGILRRPFRAWIRERLRIFRWIFRLLRR